MQHRWEGYLLKAEAEAPRIKQEAANAPTVKDQAVRAKNQATTSTQTTVNGGSSSMSSPSTY